MKRRDLLKDSAIALAASVGSVSFAHAQSAPHASEAVFNVRTFGATGEGKTLDTDAINKAIAAVAAAGGGTLLFPAGIYACFTIRLLSNVDLYLSRGCTILAADSPKPHQTSGYNGGTYLQAEPDTPAAPFTDYGHAHWRNSLFYAEDQHNFSILGPGLIHGKGLSNGHPHGNGGYPAFIAEQAGVGNKALGFKNCHNVLLRDFSILKGGHFAILATGVDNLTIDNVLIDTDRDGIDLDCCRNVRVSNCTINAPWDDALCPKSSYALGYARPTENITLCNNFITGGYELGSVVAGTWKKFPDSTSVIRQGRIKFGTESNGGFRNVTITGNVLEACKGIALETSDGAYVEDVVISGNTIRDCVDAPLFIRLNRRNRGPVDTMRPGALRRILISDFVSYNSTASTSSLILGVPNNLIEDVKISNCFFSHEGLPKRMRTNWGGEFADMPDWKTIKVPEQEDAYPELLHFGPTPSHGFFIRHARNLEFSHIEIAPQNPDPRPAFHLEDVHRADFFAITAPKQGNFALTNVTDFRLAWSRAAADTQIDTAKDQLV